MIEIIENERLLNIITTPMINGINPAIFFFAVISVILFSFTLATSKYISMNLLSLILIILLFYFMKFYPNKENQVVNKYFNEEKIDEYISKVQRIRSFKELSKEDQIKFKQCFNDFPLNDNGKTKIEEYKKYMKNCVK